MLERLEQLEADCRSIPITVMRDVVVRLAKNEILQEDAEKVFMWAFETRRMQPALLAVARAAEGIFELFGRYIEDGDDPRWVALCEALAQLKEANDG